MNLTLEKCGSMALGEVGLPEAREGYVLLKVLCCGVCRTDAKMWQQGHRDLLLPRVLGHEIAGVDESTGKIYTVWPGQTCGNCSYCESGRENLCEEMKIIGFHSDGGFASHVLVPLDSLIPAPSGLTPELITFAEPAGCVINALSMLRPMSGERAIIYGGGVVGMIAAFMLKNKGCTVTVIEQSQEKIARLDNLALKNSIEICKDTVTADFDLAMNCCASHVAFSLCITKLRKGGRLGFFSGLSKNQEIDTNLLNLIHYKELILLGSYGPKRADMVEALRICGQLQDTFSLLIERVVSLDEVEALLPSILDGKHLKCIVKIGGSATAQVIRRGAEGSAANGVHRGINESSKITDILDRIVPTSCHLKNQAQKKVDLKTKPLGALGQLEKLAVQLSCIQKNLNPSIEIKRLFVFAGDHGVVEEGVSAYPAKVTVQMVDNFLKGGAAINVFCKQYTIELAVVDMGVNASFSAHPLLMDKKVARGTNNFAITTAMSPSQAVRAIENGMDCFLEKQKKQPCELVGLGEMGIGNTSSATAVICAATGKGVEEIVGRGTGVDDRGLLRKKEVLEKALALHKPRSTDALELLQAVGGYELGGICGAVLAAASEGCCVVLDGIISTAGGLLAYLICPEVKDYLVAGHKSVEVGQKAALDLMGLDPVLDLDFRLGEGTGAAITMNLIELSCRMMRDMASFEEARVDTSPLYG
ncbi:nicotinate-nucleotide--dimethylbenzimidazole phosphoribosyltransferase [Desulfopila inferna]|uniref:nicotinate-nucleotide--dimethylbenzimidazole phosphoribosyltransferase n=1 Tax=Desulfopila inferna TaxID=468528 RepID=UPI001963A7DA|nr:nicotinate-nucleotide--dimethylbenzimidazole phosphoribosyltransferase [Desulfopila inferna]MBM9606232.1 nicotinate-nucleotide--dimethylbenzimidazole phosphoribosyltransferase [Desulfopila inferna]